MTQTKAKKQLVNLEVQCVNMPARPEINDAIAKFQDEYEIHQLIKEHYDGDANFWFGVFLATKLEVEENA